MRKIERIYCEILDKYFHGYNIMTQKQLALDCMVSIGIVNYAIKPLLQMGIIEKKNKGFILLNPKKLLLYWSSIHNLANEIIYSTYSAEKTRVIENMMPPCIFTAYTGYKYTFETVPADYREVYIYADLETIKKRFPPIEKYRYNIFTLRTDAYIEKKAKRGIAPPQLIYVDLWNLNTWYANEFIKDFNRKLEEKKIGFLE